MTDYDWLLEDREDLLREAFIGGAEMMYRLLGDDRVDDPFDRLDEAYRVWFKDSLSH